MEFAIFILLLILLDIAAWRWGVDSTERIENYELKQYQTLHRTE